MNELNDYYRIGEDIAKDSNVEEYLCVESGSDVELYNFYVQRIGEMVSRAKYRQDNMQIRIYTSNNNLKFSGIFYRNAEMFEEKSKIAAQYSSSACWLGISEQQIWVLNKQTPRKFLSFLMPIMNYDQSMQPVGVLEIGIDTSALQEMVDTQNISENIVLLIDDSGRPILSNVAADSELLAIAAAGPKQQETENYVSYQGKKYLATLSDVSSAKIGINGWTLCNLIPLDYVNRNRGSIIGASVTVCAACLLVVIPLLYLFARTITRRLEYLANRMDDIRHAADYQFGRHLQFLL